MGLLAAAARTAIAAGNPIRQVWTIKIPIAAGSSTFDSKIIDSGIVTGTGGEFKSDNQRVIRAGTRKFQMFNPNPMVKPKAVGTTYAFVVDNHDGYFYHQDDVVWQATTSPFYEAAPQECKIQHFPAVWSGTGWIAIAEWLWTGRIYKPVYNDRARSDANPLGLSATISAESDCAWPALRRDWNKDDSNESVVNDGAGEGYYQFTIAADEWD